ncbi:ABC transporter substrate-binding protein [Amycolatopsis sp. NPDC023774]|uniref:ABC transporter substrate-binding protein n=1 Tax=Amycolatopsis sp. NPDC023774 TaxID=3155015 RepID=UPI0033DC5B11
MVDLGSAFALSAAADGLLAHYQVTTFDDIPAGQKADDGSWFFDYGGFISIGYDASKVTDPPTTLADLKKPEYKGKVALNGDPTKAGAAFAGVYAAALANGGSFADIKPGVQFFADLKKSGNFIPVQSSAATIESGQTPITLDWDYLQAGYAAKLKARSTGRSPSRATASTRTSTPRASARPPRTRPPHGCGRSFSTPTRARTRS